MLSLAIPSSLEKPASVRWLIDPFFKMQWGAVGSVCTFLSPFWFPQKQFFLSSFKILFARIFQLIIGWVLMLSGRVVQPTTLHSPELNLYMHIDAWLAVMKVKFISPGFLAPSLPSCPRKAYKEKTGLALYLLPVFKKKIFPCLIFPDKFLLLDWCSLNMMKVMYHTFHNGHLPSSLSILFSVMFSVPSCLSV